ncbi:MAG: hypothetical protein KIH62_004210, partial [Candidatus Kerfeldbacteria bacterium]|nr:hypothetical protein [Candidatus Kerfeldbacteria bacterium]
TATVNIFRGGITQTGSGIVSITGSATFNTNAQALSGTQAIATVTVTGVTLTNTNALTVSTTIAGTGEFANAITGTVNYGGSAAPTISTLTMTAAGNTFSYNRAGTQTCVATTYYHLTLATSGAKTCAPTAVSGNVTLSGTATWTLSSSFAIDGNLDVGSGTTLTTAGFVFTVTGTTSVTGTLALSNNTGNKTFTGAITVNNGGTLNGASTAIIVQGGIINNGTVSVTGTATMDTASGVLTANTAIAITTLVVTGVEQTFSGPSTITISSLTVTSPGSVTNSGTTAISSTFAGTGSFTNDTSATLNINASTPSITTLTATATENIVNYSTVNPSCKVTTYYHLNFTNSGNVNCAVTSVTGNLALSGTVSWLTTSTIAVAGTLTVGSGTTLTTGAGSGLNITGTTSVSGTLANSNAASKIYGDAVTINSGGSWTNASNSSITLQNGFTNNSAGTVNFGSTANITCNTNDQSFSGTNAVTLPNLIVTGVTVTNNGALGISGVLSGSGTFAQGSASTLNVDGSITVSSFIASASNNTVNYTATTDAQTVASTSYYNLTIAKSSQTATLAGAITVLGALTISSGTLDTASNYAINIAGNYTNNGTFTPHTSTVTFNGSGQQTLAGTLTGSSAFYGLSITNNSGVDDPGCGTSFTPGVIFLASVTATEYTITSASARVQYLSGGTYTFTNINWNGGASGTQIFFRNSNLSAGAWLLHVSGTQTAVSYVNVGGSDASSGNSILAYNGTNTDCNDNVNWAFSNGALSVDIVDGSGASVMSPAVVLSAISVSIASQTSTGTFGTGSQKIRISNSTFTPTWTLTLAATFGATSVWTGSTGTYDFNDPTSDAGDGVDADSVGGQLTITPTSGTITPQGGCSTTGLSFGSVSAFSQDVVNSVTLLSSSGSTDTDCYWDITGIDLSQSVPAAQPAGSDYSLDMTLTITAS